MAQPISKAAFEILESRVFKEAVSTGDYTKLHYELVRFGQEVHKATCISCTKVYGSVKYSAADLVKQWIRATPEPKVEYYLRK